MVLIFFLLINFCFASQDNIYLGEKKIGDYFGPESPLVYQRFPKNTELTYDGLKKESYFFNLISKDLGFLNNFFKNEFINKCSNEELSRNLDQFIFAHRLISLSYLYESFRNNEKTLKKLGQNYSCHIKNEVSSCRPKTIDMKIFIENLKSYVEYDKASYLKSSFSVKKFKTLFQEGFKEKAFDLIHYRLNEFSTLKMKSLCSKDKKLFLSICSEEDSLFGMYENLESYNLILKSGFFRNIKSLKSCLKRFKYEFKDSEIKHEELQIIFSYLFQRLSNKNYREGKVFSLGTLREFYDKGLTLYSSKKERKNSIKKRVLKKNKEIVKIVKIKKKDIKKLVEKKVVRKVRPKDNHVKFSSFFKAQRKLEKEKLESVKLDMNSFRYDYIISLDMKKRLKEALKKFISLESLNILKSKDKLGSEQGAIPLLFIKYLIENEDHKSLYNLTDILGDEFFVQNDIDKNVERKEQKIRLINNQKTDFSWQIELITY